VQNSYPATKTLISKAFYNIEQCITPSQFDMYNNPADKGRLLLIPALVNNDDDCLLRRRTPNTGLR